MAERKPQKTQTVPTPGVPVQYRDLDRVGQRVLNNKAKDIGKGVKARVSAAADRLDQSSYHKSDKEASTLRGVLPHVRNADTSIDAMASRRANLVEDGVRRQSVDGSSSGEGWYYRHHADIAQSAKPHGVHPDAAITAAALMSPQNSPTDEKAATAAIMHQQSGAPMTPEVEKDLNRSGTKTNLRRAQEYLEGHASTGDTSNPINPHTAPKIWTYAENSKAAVPNTPDHNEYMTRVGKMQDSISGEVHPGQGQLDIWGLRDSREGLLNPERPTVEDTWMNSYSSGQSLEASVGRANVAKTVGSSKHLDYGRFGVRDRQGNSVGMPGVSSSAMLHAVNVESTVRAADTLGQKHGVLDSQGRSALPSVAVQEMAWTEGRKVAGKDPEYTRHMESRSQQTTPGSAGAKRILPGQKPLFKEL